MPENLKVYADRWKSLKIWNHFNYFNLKENILKLKLSKKESKHIGILHRSLKSDKYLL